MTSGLDEVEIKLIQDTFEYATQLKERKEEVIRLIDEQEKLTEELAKEINAATKLQRVEDLYRPYRKKRRTRATVDRKSTRLNSSHVAISYAVFCLKKKNK